MRAIIAVKIALGQQILFFLLYIFSRTEKSMNYRVVIIPGIWSCLLWSCLFAAQLLAETTARKIYVAYPEVTDTHDMAFYYQQALKLALDKTRATDGDFVLEFSSQMLTIDRSMQQVVSGHKADIMWGSVTAERSKVVLVVPHDLLRGLNQYRLLIINPKNQKKFSKIKNIDEFKQFISGGADSWTITKILRRNGIEVRTAPYYVSLLKMLSAGRFDYLVRGLHEVRGDVEWAAALELDIAIESSILLEYKNPITYSFFVSKQNPQLADRLMRGLDIAEKDGSLQERFNALTLFEGSSDFLHQNRRVFTLQNDE
jgi:Bacterial extracellular solute-binding proteins, family 3